MPNSIDINDSNNKYFSFIKKEREGSALEIRDEKMQKTQSLDEQSQTLRQKEEEKKKENLENSLPQRGDYRNLIDRIAEQEVKKSKLSAFTHNQKDLLKQLENTISPTSEHSYDLKV